MRSRDLLFQEASLQREEPRQFIPRAVVGGRRLRERRKRVVRAVVVIMLVGLGWWVRDLLRLFVVEWL